MTDAGESGVFKCNQKNCFISQNMGNIEPEGMLDHVCGGNVWKPILSLVYDGTSNFLVVNSNDAMQYTHRVLKFIRSIFFENYATK
jgi:hypothetical protein